MSSNQSPSKPKTSSQPSVPIPVAEFKPWLMNQCLMSRRWFKENLHLIPFSDENLNCCTKKRR